MAIVQRAPGDCPGDEIVSPILKTDAAQVERGRQEINYNSTDRVIKVCVPVDSAYITPGEIVSIQDMSGTSLGMVTDYSVEIKHGSVRSSVTVECVI